MTTTDLTAAALATFKCPVCASPYFGAIFEEGQHVGRYCKGWPSGYDRSYQPCRGGHEEKFAAASAALAAQQAGPPDGWKLVPVEPTEAMLRVADRIIGPDPRFMVMTWRAMLAAAPEPPVEDASIDKAWQRFEAKDAEIKARKTERVHAMVNAGLYPGMSEAFDAHMGSACWADHAYRNDAATWAAAWRKALAAQAAPVAGEPVALPPWWGDFIQRICEIPDRNSPEDEPEAMVATAKELENCALNAMEDFALAAPPAPAPVPPMLTEQQIAEVAFSRYTGCNRSEVAEMCFGSDLELARLVEAAVRRQFGA